MSLLCTVIGHTPSATRQHNQGYAFSLCHHCGRDLILGEEDQAWKPVPKGFRVAWRPAPRAAAHVAERLLSAPTPRRRDPRNARPAPRRDPRGRPIAGAATMVSLLANLGELMGAECGDDVLPVVKQPVIRLPGATR